ncbi:hypothetical protein [Thiomonas sp. FB-6]|uniref:hypothetical protein n=1 Tax=Thiomonas sp. FB-6 TaxID=1158291 RepID=UPI0012DE18CF|nr:hypothetical protein [Thiomonas sp. FB-6]
MERKRVNLIEAVLAADKSLDGVRAAFSSLGDVILRQQRSVEQKVEQHERSAARGARSTQHRFHP